MLATDRSYQKLSAGRRHGSAVPPPQIDIHSTGIGPIEHVRQALQDSASGPSSGQDRSALAGSIDELSCRLQRLHRLDERFRRIGFSCQLVKLRKQLG